VRLGLVGRGDADVHRLALEQRRPLDYAVFPYLFRELVQKVSPDLRVGELPASELDRDLDSVAVFQERDRPPHLRIEVAGADLGLQPDFLESDGALPPLGFLLTLGQFVLVLTEIEESRHRWAGEGCDFYQVEPPLLREPQGVGRSHDTQLATVFVDDPDVEDSDHLIYAQVSANSEPLS
jgi:hypothetical protein